MGRVKKESKADLQQTSKAELRNYIIEESVYKPIKKSDWLIDSMAAINICSSRTKLGDYASALLKFCLPPQHTEPRRLGIIFDSYSSATTKQLT